MIKNSPHFHAVVEYLVARLISFFYSFIIRNVNVLSFLSISYSHSNFSFPFNSNILENVFGNVVIYDAPCLRSFVCSFKLSFSLFCFFSSQRYYYFICFIRYIIYH